MSNAGRPTKLNKDRQAEIVASIDEGTPFELAAKAAGIAPSSLYLWLERGHADSISGIVTEYSKFSEAVHIAIKRRILRNLRRTEEGDTGWQGASWSLGHHPLTRKYFGADAEQLEMLQAQINEIKKLFTGTEKGVVENG